jgi:hypothetical protein
MRECAIVVLLRNVRVSFDITHHICDFSIKLPSLVGPISVRNNMVPVNVIHPNLQNLSYVSKLAIQLISPCIFVGRMALGQLFMRGYVDFIFDFYLYFW